MAHKKIIVEPIPQSWLDPVIQLLEEGDITKIVPSATALMTMSAVGIGFTSEAFDLCLESLKSPNACGEHITDMTDKTDGSTYDTWAFPCRHPLNDSSLVFAKIGLHEDEDRGSLISLHVDLKGTLKAAVIEHMKKTKSS